MRRRKILMYVTAMRQDGERLRDKESVSQDRKKTTNRKRISLIAI